MNTDYYKNIKKACARYRESVREIIEDNDYWGWEKSIFSREQVVGILFLIDQLEEKIKIKLPIEKLNKMFGYVQGMLIAGRITSNNAERKWKNPIFLSFDFIDEPL